MVRGGISQCETVSTRGIEYIKINFTLVTKQVEEENKNSPCSRFAWYIKRFPSSNYCSW